MNHYEIDWRLGYSKLVIEQLIILLDLQIPSHVIYPSLQYSRVSWPIVGKSENGATWKSIRHRDGIYSVALFKETNITIAMESIFHKRTKIAGTCSDIMHKMTFNLHLKFTSNAIA